MTTIKNLTEQQISRLRTEANSAHDYKMAVICDLALAGSVDLDDYTVLERDEERAIASMSQQDAYTAVVRAIGYAETQVTDAAEVA